MKWFKRIAIFVVVLIIVYLLGPHPAKPVYNTQLPQVPPASELERYVRQKEAMHKLRPNNEARIVWANESLKQQTNYSIVYLHGFSACQEEGNPVHREIAGKFGCNLYLSRLAEHGIDTSEQLLNLTADRYWESAKEALVIGKQLGQKVILMGTSTGATQALQLAAAYPDQVSALILYSPNIAINDGSAWLLNNPWGLQIARLVKMGKYNTPDDARPLYKQYWNTPYRLEALVQLEEMLETTMTRETFSKITQPVLMLYYFKDEKHQDNVVKVAAMKSMFDDLNTPVKSKREIALPKTGDHVIGSPIKSGDISSVEKETTQFLEEVMHLNLKN
jgi:pimeloyl-ACP methyl ester carboxylesterase